MITEKDLISSIDECLTEPITGSKRSVLADLIIIHNYLFGEPIEDNRGYSYENRVEKSIIQTNSDTEFLQLVNGKDINSVLDVMQELMDAVKILQPRMYDSVLTKIQDI